MQGETSESEICLVYRGKGTDPAQFYSPPITQQRPTIRPSAASVALNQIMSRKLICARPDLDAAVIVQLMLQHHVGCIPVIDDRRKPVGMITKHDVIEQLNATMATSRTGSPFPEDLQARCADEVMMPLAFCLPETASIAHATAMMMSEDTHHVIVVDAEDCIVGVVSSRDIVGWLLETDGP
jgi:CBS-domain-containing membrane protein